MRELAEGALRFSVRMRITGDHGGSLDEESAREARRSGSSADVLQDALRACEGLSENELMETVVEEFTFTVCPACRAAVRADPAGASTSRPAARRGVQ